MFPSTQARVPLNTTPEVNEMIRTKTLANVELYSDKTKEEITRRMKQLGYEWDTERLLEASASSLMILTSLLGITRSRLWFLASGAIGAFLLQHALNGWCPPVPVIRRLGVRTATEIHEEMTALRLVRGDFGVMKDAKTALKLARTPHQT